MLKNSGTVVGNARQYLTRSAAGVVKRSPEAPPLTVSGLHEFWRAGRADTLGPGLAALESAAQASPHESAFARDIFADCAGCARDVHPVTPLSAFGNHDSYSERLSICLHTFERRLVVDIAMYVSRHDAEPLSMRR